MIPTNKTVEIYYLVDEFLKEYDAVIKSHSLWGYSSDYALALAR